MLCIGGMVKCTKNYQANHGKEWVETVVTNKKHEEAHWHHYEVKRCESCRESVWVDDNTSSTWDDPYAPTSGGHWETRWVDCNCEWIPKKRWVEDKYTIWYVGHNRYGKEKKRVLRQATELQYQRAEYGGAWDSIRVKY
jgi:hypothetical protein